MRGFAKCALVAIAIVVGALVPAFGQTPPEGGRVPPTVTRVNPITPLGWFVIGSIGCAAVSPMIGTVILGRELTLNEAYRSTFGCVLGPVGLAFGGCAGPAHGHGSRIPRTICHTANQDGLCAGVSSIFLRPERRAL